MDIVERLRSAAITTSGRMSANDRIVVSEALIDAATEIARLRKDAERYRWLRMKCGLVPSALGIGQVAMTLAGSTDERDAKRLDAHIDAAMCEEGANT